MRAGSGSPLRRRESDHHQYGRAGSGSPLRRRESDHHQYGRAGSGSPLRRRASDHHQYGSEFDHSGGPPPRNRELGNGRDAERYRAPSPPPPHGRGRVGGYRGRGGGGNRSFGRGFDGPRVDRALPLRGEALNRTHPNVRPREGDWYCQDPQCGNLNFARREYCNTCKKQRGPAGGGMSPRRAFPGPPPPPPPHAPFHRFSGPALDRAADRPMRGGYRSPPRGWARDELRNGPREFGGRGRGRGSGPFHPRHEGRFPDRRDRPDYPEENFRERNKFDRPMPPPPEWGHRDREREDFFNDRKGYERRMPSPSPPRGNRREQWPPRDARERSRSPLRGGRFSPKDYRRGDMYMERGGPDNDRRGVGRGGSVGGAY